MFWKGGFPGGVPLAKTVRRGIAYEYILSMKRMAALAGGGASAAAADGAIPVAPVAVEAPSVLLAKALDDGLATASRIETLNEIAAEVGGVHFAKGRIGRRGQGYTPMVEGEDGEFYAYTSAELTKSDLETALLCLRSVRDKAEKGDKQTITNFISRINVEIGKR